MSAPLALQKNRLIDGKYRLARRIGYGAIGEVWVARNETIDRDVAMKFLRPRARTQPAAIEAFKRGARESGRLRHPCVLELLDLLDVDGMPCVVTALLEAEKLGTVLARRGKLNVGAALRLAHELARALAFAHEQGVVHGRVSPANVLLHRDPRGAIVPTLMDFGVARLVDLAAPPSLETATSIEMFGELAYLSPEQVAFERDVDGRSDVFALGVLLHHAIAGEPPFRARKLAELREEQRRDLPRLHELDPRIDAGVDELCAAALVRARGSRIAARAFAERAATLLQRIPDEWVELAAEAKLAERLDAPLPGNVEAHPSRPSGATPIAALRTTPTPGKAAVEVAFATPAPARVVTQAIEPSPSPPAAAVTPSPAPASIVVAPSPPSPAPPVVAAPSPAPPAAIASPAPAPQGASHAAVVNPFATPAIASSGARLADSPLFAPSVSPRVVAAPSAPLLAPTPAPAPVPVSVDAFDPEAEWAAAQRGKRGRRALVIVGVVLVMGAVGALLATRAPTPEKPKPQPTEEGLKLLPAPR